MGVNKGNGENVSKCGCEYISKENKRKCNCALNLKSALNLTKLIKGLKALPFLFRCFLNKKDKWKALNTLV